MSKGTEGHFDTLPIGRLGLIPAIFNINEPILFGTPIVFNPILMMPMWICTTVNATIVWIVMRTGLLAIPTIERNHSCTVLHRDVHRRYAWRNLVGCVPGSGSADLVSILQDLRKAGSREGGRRGSGKGINRKFDKIKRENTTYER